jgi:hypothetical protein
MQLISCTRAWNTSTFKLWPLLNAERRQKTLWAKLDAPNEVGDEVEPQRNSEVASAPCT